MLNLSVTSPLKEPLMFSPQSSPFGGGFMSSLCRKNWTVLSFNARYNFVFVLPEVQALCNGLHDPRLPPPVSPVHRCVREGGEVEAGCSGEEKKNLFQHFFGENWPQCTPPKVVQLFREETSKCDFLKTFHEIENLCSSILVPVHMSCGPLQTNCSSCAGDEVTFS